MKFTIVYCYRNRDLERVKRSIESLLDQKNQNFQIIFVDYGSAPEYQEAVQSYLTPIAKVNYRFIDTRGHLWNRAHALNIGIRLAQTDFVFSADIDQLFHADFTELLVNLSQQHEVCYLNTFLLPEGFDYSEELSGENLDKSSLRGRGLSLIRKTILEKHGGYSEMFSIWGYEDNELHERLERQGLESVYVDNDFMFHQWHPRIETTHATFPHEWRSFMRDLFDHPDSHGLAFFWEKEWGAIPTQRLDRDRATSVQLQGTLPYIQYKIATEWSLLASRNVATFQFKETTYQQYTGTTNYKLAQKLTNLFKKVGLSLEVTSIFQNRNLSIYDMRDVFIYFTYQQRVVVYDYYLEMNERDRTITLWLQKL